MKGLMVAINLNDIGAELKEKGVISKDSFHKVKKLIPILASSGVSEIYLYGGLFEMSEVSKSIHRVPTSGKHFIRSNKAIVKLDGYKTKSELLFSPVNNNKILLKDNLGNPFSIVDHRCLNPLLMKNQDNSLTLEREFKELVSVIKSYNIKLTVDFIPWLSQDIINYENYEWTFYKEIDSVSNDSLIKMDTSEREIELQRILDLPENDRFAIIEIQAKDRQKFLLIARLAFYGIYSADQVALNALNPVVQDYYISSMKKLVDLGVNAVRVDLGHLLLKKYLISLYFFILPENIRSNLSNKNEPWERIISEVNDYSLKKNNSTFDFYMESYHTPDREHLLKLGAKRVYYKELYDSYIDVIRNKGSTRTIKSAVAYALFKKINGHTTIVFPSNFDELSLMAIGGPKRAFTILLITLAHLGVSIMVDLREWLDHRGHIIPMVGGYENHPFVTQEELNSRYNFNKLEEQVKDAFWKKTIALFKKAVITEEEEFIEFVDNSNLDKYLSFAWKTEDGSWISIICDFSIKSKEEVKESSPMWVAIPNELLKLGDPKLIIGAELDPVCNEEKDRNNKLKIFDEIEEDKTFWRIKLEFNESEEFKLLKLKF